MPQHDMREMVMPFMVASADLASFLALALGDRWHGMDDERKAEALATHQGNIDQWGVTWLPKSETSSRLTMAWGPPAPAVGLFG